MEDSTKDIVGKVGQELRGRRIALGVTGSVSAHRASDIARTLMRHGADVHCVMTQGAQKIINPNLMEWSTGNQVVTELTGRVEHVGFTTGPGRVDLLLIAPATANTIGKMACGIDDTPVTSYFSSALGAGIPIVVAPAMHETMLRHQIIQDNLRKLAQLGIEFVPPMVEEGKAKLASADAILASVISSLTQKDMTGLSVLITGGPTVERVDPIRILTNQSSGKMAVSLAEAGQRRGADVTLIYGPGVAEPPSNVRVTRVQTSQDMHRAVLAELSAKKYQIMIAAAAVSDYAPARFSSTKIRSSGRKRLTIELKRTPKIIDAVKKTSPSTFLTLFKAEHSLSEAELLKRAERRLAEVRGDLVVVNDVSGEGIGFGSDENEVTVVDSDGNKTHLPRATKKEVAGRILDIVLERLRRS